MIKEWQEVYWRFLNRIRSMFYTPEAVRLTLYLGLVVKADLDGTAEMRDKRWSLAYLCLTYKELVEPDDLVEYVRELEKHYGLPDDIVAASLSNTLRRGTKDDVQNLFVTLKDLDFKGDEDLYYFYQYLIEEVLGGWSKEGRLFAPNESLSRLMGRLVDAKVGMTLHDGYCGSGLTALYADKGCELYLQDASPEGVTIAAVMAVVRGNTPKAINCNDSLVRPLTGPEMQFDRIVSALPIGLRLDKSYLEDVCHINGVDPLLCTGDTLPILQIVNQLNDKGVAVVHVGAGTLFKSGRTQRFREYLIANNLLDCVVELPNKADGHMDIVSAVLVLKKGRTADEVFFIDSSEYWTKGYDGAPFLSEEMLSKLIALYNSREKTEHSCPVTRVEILKQEAKLTPKAYIAVRMEIEISDTHELSRKQMNQHERLSELQRKLQEIRGTRRNCN